MILPDLRGLIPKTRCYVCGGAYQSMGPGSVWVPHFPGCPRGPKNVEARPASAGGVQPVPTATKGHPASTQSYESQDREREALSSLEAPFMPMIRWPDGPSALSDFVFEKPDWRRQSVAPNYGMDGP